MNVVGKFEPDGLVGDQFAVADAAVVVAADQAVLDAEIADRAAQAARRRARSGKCRACAAALRSGTAVIWMVSLAIVGALVRHHGGVAEQDDDAGKGDVELFGDDLAERGADAGAEIDMAVIGVDGAVGGDADEGLERAPPAPSGAGTTDSEPRLALSSVRMREAINRAASSELAGGAHRGADDLDMRAAAAEIVAQRFQHLALGRVRVEREQRLGGR